jgi:hypothetical protein
MAEIESMWIHGNRFNEDLFEKVKVYGLIRGIKTDVDVVLPTQFKAALIQMAQAALDAREAQLRMELLGDKNE